MSPADSPAATALPGAERTGRWSTGRTTLVLLALILASAAACLAWVAGVALEGSTSDPDYLVRPNDGLLAARPVIAVVAVLVAALAVAALIRRSRRGRPTPLGVVAPIVAIGVLAGGVYAVVTAPVVGANIGGGLAVLAGPIVLVVLVASAVTGLRRM